MTDITAMETSLLNLQKWIEINWPNVVQFESGTVAPSGERNNPTLHLNTKTGEVSVNDVSDTWVTVKGGGDAPTPVDPTGIVYLKGNETKADSVRINYTSDRAILQVKTDEGWDKKDKYLDVDVTVSNSLDTVYISGDKDTTGAFRITKKDDKTWLQQKSATAWVDVVEVSSAVSYKEDAVAGTLIYLNGMDAATSTWRMASQDDIVNLQHKNDDDEWVDITVLSDLPDVTTRNTTGILYLQGPTNVNGMGLPEAKSNDTRLRCDRGITSLQVYNGIQWVTKTKWGGSEETDTYYINEVGGGMAYKNHEGTDVMPIVTVISPTETNFGSFDHHTNILTDNDVSIKNIRNRWDPAWFTPQADTSENLISKNFTFNFTNVEPWTFDKVSVKNIEADVPYRLQILNANRDVLYTSVPDSVWNEVPMSDKLPKTTANETSVDLKQFVMISGTKMTVKIDVPELYDGGTGDSKGKLTIKGKTINGTFEPSCAVHVCILDVFEVKNESITHHTSVSGGENLFTINKQHPTDIYQPVWQRISKSTVDNIGTRDAPKMRVYSKDPEILVSHKGLPHDTEYVDFIDVYNRKFNTSVFAYEFYPKDLDKINDGDIFYADFWYSKVEDGVVTKEFNLPMVKQQCKVSKKAGDQFIRLYFEVPIETIQGTSFAVRIRTAQGVNVKVKAAAEAPTKPYNQIHYFRWTEDDVIGQSTINLLVDAFQEAAEVDILQDDFGEFIAWGENGDYTKPYDKTIGWPWKEAPYIAWVAQ